MKYTIILLALILASCSTYSCNEVGLLKTPLRVISLGTSDWEYNNLVVIDIDNNLYTLKGACFQSLKVGDTIR